MVDAIAIYILQNAGNVGWNVQKLGDQASKGTRRMPWRQESMKGVGACEKFRGAGKQAFDPEIPEWGNPLPQSGSTA